MRPFTVLDLHWLLHLRAAMNSFGEPLALLRNRAETGERVFLELGLKPEYLDTPRNWEMLVEGAFARGER